MQHDADCRLHAAPSDIRGMCTCGVARSIARAADAAHLTQQLIEDGPASADMTAAAIALTTAREALTRAMIAANSGK